MFLFSISHFPCVWKDLEEGIVTNSEFQWFLPIVGITFLSILGSDEVFTDNCKIVNYFLNIVCFWEMLVLNFIPASRGSARSTIESLVWSHANTRMVVIIVGNFNQK